MAVMETGERWGKSGKNFTGSRGRAHNRDFGYAAPTAGIAGIARVMRGRDEFGVTEEDEPT